MHPQVVHRESLHETLTATIDALERTPLPAGIASALHARLGESGGTVGDGLVAVLGDAREFLRRDAHIGAPEAAADSRSASAQNLPYIASHRTLSLVQSALDEYLEMTAAPEPFDPTDPGWLTVVGERLQALFRGARAFVRHRSPSDFVELLPDAARIALVSDWGTGSDHAVRVMRQITAVHPTHVVHLGDVYFSGTEREVQTRFLNIIRAVGPAAPCVYRALNSNHEMYSGGYAYFDLTLPAFGQPASYFNLRSPHWQIIGLDTAHEDHGLRDPQAEWLAAQLDAGSRRTILLSHHQLFSAFEERPRGQRLAARIAPLLPRVYGWIWGHEHKCVLYDRHQGIHARCIGHGAIPYRVPFREARGAPVLAADERQEPGGGGFHGFALLTLDGPSARIAYIDEYGHQFRGEETFG